jgi:outer membrane lipoprotein-sorting protein
MGPLFGPFQIARKEDVMLRKYLLGLAFLGASVVAANAQTVDELIAKNVQARGGLDKMKAVNTVRFSGKMGVGPGIEAPVTLELKRPSQMRMEFTFQGMVGVQAYDGTTGWQIEPFGGKKDPEPMSPEDLKQAQEQADMDGPLVDYKAKGHTVEFLGKDKLEGSDVFKLKVGLKNGDTQYIYLDADSYLEIKNESKRMVRGTEVEEESTVGDYKEVNGLLFPFSLQFGARGRPDKQNLTIEKVEINPAVDDVRFKMPSAKPAEQPK